VAVGLTVVAAFTFLVTGVTGVAFTGFPQLAMIAKENFPSFITTKDGREFDWNDTLGGRE